MTGLTRLHEHGTGFVGSHPMPKIDTTKAGRPRIKFEVACGQNKEETGQFTTWRHCIGYSPAPGDIQDNDIVKALELIKVGDLVEFSGWVKTEGIKDDEGQLVKDNEGRYRLIEYLLLYDAQIMAYQKKAELQPALIK